MRSQRTPPKKRLRISPKKAPQRKTKAMMLGLIGDTVVTPKKRRRSQRLRIKKQESFSFRAFLSSLLTQKLFFLALIVFTCCVCVVFALATDVFDLRRESIRVTTVGDALFDLDVAYAHVGSLVGRKTLFLTSQEVFDLLHPSFPHLKSVKTSVLFPDGYSVELDAYDPVFQTMIDGVVYNVMENGSIVGSQGGDQLDIPFLQIVGAPEGFDPRQGFLLSFLEVQKISSLFGYLQKHRNIFPSVYGFLYYYSENEIHVVGDTRLLLSFDVPFVDVLDNVRALESQMLGQYFTRDYVYLDLRVADRMYACPSSQMTTCQEYLFEMYGENWDADWGAPGLTQESEEV